MVNRRPSSSVSCLGLLPEAWSSTSQVALNSAVSVSKWYSQYMSSITITKFGSLTIRVHHHWTDDVKPLEFQMEAQDDYVLKGTCLSSPPFLQVPGQFLRGKVDGEASLYPLYHVFILEGYPFGENPKTIIINWRLYVIPEKFYSPILSLKKTPYSGALPVYRY